MTLDYVHMADIMDHIVEIEKKITIDVMGILDKPMNVKNAFAYSRRNNAEYPQWLNGLSNDKPEDFGIAEMYEPFTISTQLQVGKIDEGVEGELEQSLFTWIPYTEAVFRTSPRLTSAARPDIPHGLLWASIRLSDALMPGDVIAARFVISLACFAHNVS